MSARALEFVENWVSEKLDAMKFPAGKHGAQALAAQCVADAKRNGIPQSEVNAAFADLAAFIAGEIDEAGSRRADRSSEKHPGNLVEGDDARIVEDAEDDLEKEGD